MPLNLKPEVEASVSQGAAKEGAAVSEYLERTIPKRSRGEAQSGKSSRKG